MGIVPSVRLGSSGELRLFLKLRINEDKWNYE